VVGRSAVPSGRNRSSGTTALGLPRCVVPQEERRVLQQPGEAVRVARGIAVSFVAHVAISSPVGIAVDPAASRAYTANNNGGTVSVIDTTTNTVLTTITVGSGPKTVKLNTATHRAYVTNSNTNTVSVIDTTTETVVDTITVGSEPTGLEVNPQTNRVYVSNRNDRTLSVIDTTGDVNSIVTTISGIGDETADIAINLQFNRIYAVNAGNGDISIIDGATNTIIGSVFITSNTNSPFGIAIDQATGLLYVADARDNTIVVIGPGPTAVNGDNATATFGDASVTLTATVTSAQTGGVNEGTVTFTVRRADNSVLGTATSGPVVNGAASATFALPSGTGGGTYSVVAQYNATSPTFAGSVDATPATLTVNRAAQTITFAQPANRNPNDAPFTVSPTTTSGLPLTIDAAGPCLVSGTTVTLAGQSGTCALTARQAGDANYLPATATRTFQIGAGSAIIASASGNGTVSPAGTTVYGNGTVASYTATAAAGQTFTGWTLDGAYVGYANPLTITVNSSHALVATFVATPTFSDLGPLSAADRQAITFLAARGIVNPAGINGSGQFQPGGDVARAEVAAFIARAFGWENEFHANTFPDRCVPGNTTNCIDAKLWNDVAALKDYGIVGGYTDPATCQAGGTTAPCYLPRDGVQRVQVVSIVARAFIKTPDLRPTGFWDRLAADTAQYTNVGTEGTQRSDLTTYRANAGELPGQGDSATFVNPGGNSTRLFVIQVLYQAYNAQFGVDRVP